MANITRLYKKFKQIMSIRGKINKDLIKKFLVEKANGKRLENQIHIITCNCKKIKI